MSICNVSTPTAEQLANPQWWDESAPNRATHFDPGDLRNPWIMNSVDGWSFYSSRGQEWIKYYQKNLLEVNERRLIPRPAWPAVPEWMGLMPAVGDECEAVWLEAPDGGSREYEPVIVKGYFKTEIMQVWFCTQHGEDLVCRMDNCSFRPLRTPAVRERDDLAGALLDDMDALDIHMPGSTARTISRTIASRIMKRGWRKGGDK